MTSKIICRNRAPGQNELTGVTALVDRAAYGVPNVGSALPLVKQSRDCAFKLKSGIGSHAVACRPVDVEPDGTCSPLQRGLRLPSTNPSICTVASGTLT